MTTRPAVPADESLLWQLHQERRSPEYAPLGLPAAQLADLLRMQRHCEQVGWATQFPNAEYCIVELDGAAVGRVIYDRAPDRVLVVDLALFAKYQDRRIGGEVLTALVRDSAPVPVESSMVHGARSRQFVLRYGFREVARDDVYVRMRSS